MYDNVYIPAFGSPGSTSWCTPSRQHNHYVSIRNSNTVSRNSNYRRTVEVSNFNWTHRISVPKAVVTKCWRELPDPNNSFGLDALADRFECYNRTLQSFVLSIYQMLDVVSG